MQSMHACICTSYRKYINLLNNSNVYTVSLISAHFIRDLLPQLYIQPLKS